MNYLSAFLAGIATFVALRPAERKLSSARWSRLNVDAVARVDATPPASGPSGPSSGRPGSADEVATCCELLSVAVTSGRTPAEAVQDVGAMPSSGPVLAVASEDLRRGRSLAEVLEDLAQGDGGWHSMATLLAMSANSGADASEPLRRLAAAERTRMRRKREATARRLPVLLLLPLTGLVLPAFALVTVVPFAIAGVESFELPPVVEPAEPPGNAGEN